MQPAGLFSNFHQARMSIRWIFNKYLWAAHSVPGSTSIGTQYIADEAPALTWITVQVAPQCWSRGCLMCVNMYLPLQSSTGLKINFSAIRNMAPPHPNLAQKVLVLILQKRKWGSGGSDQAKVSQLRVGRVEFESCSLYGLSNYGAIGF